MSDPPTPPIDPFTLLKSSATTQREHLTCFQFAVPADGVCLIDKELFTGTHFTVAKLYGVSADGIDTIEEATVHIHDGGDASQGVVLLAVNPAIARESVISEFGDPDTCTSTSEQLRINALILKAVHAARQQLLQYHGMSPRAMLKQVIGPRSRVLAGTVPGEGCVRTIQNWDVCVPKHSALLFVPRQSVYAGEGVVRQVSVKRVLTGYGSDPQRNTIGLDIIPDPLRPSEESHFDPRDTRYSVPQYWRDDVAQRLVQARYHLLLQSRRSACSSVMN